MLTMSSISKCKMKPGSCFIHVTDIISGRPWTCQPRSGNIASCYIKSLYIFIDFFMKSANYPLKLNDTK